MSIIVLKVLAWVLPVLLGPLVYFVADMVLNTTKRIDDLPAVVKRAAVVGMGLGIVAVLDALGVTIPATCRNFVSDDSITACAKDFASPPVVQGMVASIVAMCMHYLRKKPVWRS